MPDEKSKEQQLDDFLASENTILPTAATVSSENASAFHTLRVATEQNVMEDTAGGADKKRHSIRTCTCESCQQKRIALANKFGIVSSEEISAEDFPEIDAHMMGKLLTVPHAYKQAVNAVKYPEIAELWKVTSETEESLGKFGNAVLTKWLKKANFPYKTEIILCLYWSSDIGIRMLNESKLKALIDAEAKLKGIK